MQGGLGVLLRAPVPLSLVQQAWQQGPTAASCQVDQTLSLPEQGDGFRGGAWLVILREFVEAVVALSHLLLWLLLVLCAPWRAVSAILRIFEDSEDRFARLLRRDQHISLVNSHYSHCDRCLRRCECLCASTADAAWRSAASIEWRCERLCESAAGAKLRQDAFTGCRSNAKWAPVRHSAVS